MVEREDPEAPGGRGEICVLCKKFGCLGLGRLSNMKFVMGIQDVYDVSLVNTDNLQENMKHLKHLTLS